MIMAVNFSKPDDVILTRPYRRKLWAPLTSFPWRFALAILRSLVSLLCRREKTAYPINALSTPRPRSFKTRLYFNGSTVHTNLSEKRTFRKLSSNKRDLKTPALRVSVDGKRTENEAFRE